MTSLCEDAIGAVEDTEVELFRWLPTEVLSAIIMRATWRDVIGACQMALVSKQFHRAVFEGALPRQQVLRLASPPAPGRQADAFREGFLRLIPRLPEIVEIDLSSCYHLVTDPVVNMIWISCPLLRVLNLSSCQRLTQNSLLSFGNPEGPCLRSLSLANCSGTVNSGSVLLARTSSLEDLDISWCRQVTSAAFSKSHLSKTLRKLVATGCESLDDDFCSNTRVLFCIQDLDLRYVPISNTGLLALAGSAHHLQRLTLAPAQNNLWGCGEWTFAGVTEFSRVRPDVSVLFFS